MKLLICGEKEGAEELAEKIGFEIVKENPDIVASYGGDGTFMRAEHEFPGILKFALKRSKVCRLCYNLPTEEVLRRVYAGEYAIKDETKLEAISGKRRIVGLNEIVVHNINPRRAIRYEIFVNGKRVGNEIIGDGVIISTPHGSTGYYRSITGSFFELGIGVAFNNSTEQYNHMVLKDDTEIKVRITRGTAIAYADNIEEDIMLDDGHEIVIKKSAKGAKVVKLK